MTSTLGGGRGSPKSRGKEQKQRISVRDKGGGGGVRKCCGGNINIAPKHLSPTLPVCLDLLPNCRAGTRGYFPWFQCPPEACRSPWCWGWESRRRSCRWTFRVQTCPSWPSSPWLWTPPLSSWRVFNSRILDLDIHLGILIRKMKWELRLKWEGLSFPIRSPFWTPQNWRLNCKLRWHCTYFLVAANCNTESQIEMGDRTVEHFPTRLDNLCLGEVGEVVKVLAHPSHGWTQFRVYLPHWQSKKDAEKFACKAPRGLDSFFCLGVGGRRSSETAESKYQFNGFSEFQFKLNLSENVSKNLSEMDIWHTYITCLSNFPLFPTQKDFKEYFQKDFFWMKLKNLTQNLSKFRKSYWIAPLVSNAMAVMCSRLRSERSLRKSPWFVRSGGCSTVPFRISICVVAF